MTSFQREANAAQISGSKQVGAFWQRHRKKAAFSAVLEVLGAMAGDRQRCMYCLDSHGTDIEHFWPKTPYPAKLFEWENLLLGCTECGRLKGSKFPLDATGNPLLLDPTADDPWEHLDFDPRTGIISARFDRSLDDYCPRGKETTSILQLDRREALAIGHKKTYRRLAQIVEEFLTQTQHDAQALLSSLREADEHGLLPWCFCPRGGEEAPFAALREKLPEVFALCAAELKAPAA
ncbi:MAG: hypothetical protein JNM84_02335 [Planctomycetes bacterium]|nr:hypothetical protein [Planctomycetota bacterium]